MKVLSYVMCYFIWKRMGVIGKVYVVGRGVYTIHRLLRGK